VGTSDRIDGVRGFSKGYQRSGVVGVHNGGPSHGIISGTGPGAGVLGHSKNGTGVVGHSEQQGTGVVGHSERGNGVVGTSNASTVVGIKESAAVCAININSDQGINGAGIGVFAQSKTDGIRAESLGSLEGFGAGLWAEGLGDNGTGVRAGAPGAGGTGLECFGGRLAGKFDGHVEINGNLEVSDLEVTGWKSFKIDHPLDPENKYLLHNAVESSEMKNVYDGVVQLDEDGAAWVDLPEWFETLNGDFRYQLTAVGGAAPNLHVAEEIYENRFRIAGGEGGMNVCWQVTGSRKDPWAAANPFEVEQEKPQEERGRYLHPALYDAPEEQSVMRTRMREERQREEPPRVERPQELAMLPRAPETPPGAPAMPPDFDFGRMEEEHRRQIDELRGQIEELRRGRVEEEIDELRREIKKLRRRRKQ